ncbi:SBBP repeat-containing protein [Myxococcus landrumensis]|uniref:SBBP repeat-containing protein n=1 Tax=Myxococcus landrumensis TaxID=2813577 RepID=A0ABX7N2Z0_9BACT|nr:SBBP repeat-containing protein [Myxococcus landrumus]QSQ10778.1 SBBP repeat-containing protein [Myxococcus landrumus]
MRHPLLSTFALAGAVCAVGAPFAAEAQVPAPSWVRQLGANLDEQAQAVAVSGSSVYVVGHTSSQLGPQPKAGGMDVFVAKYTTAGALQWVQQLGTAGEDRATAVVADADGNVYVAGHTSGGFDFFTNAGGFDFFVTRFDAQGNRQWLRQNGTQMDDFGTGIALGADDTLYVSGYTGGSFANGGNPNNYDVVVALYDTGGNPYWLNQYGTAKGDVARGIAVTSDHQVYVVGNTSGAFGGASAPESGTDLFLMKLNILGVQQWVRQDDTSELEDARGVAVGADGAIYVVGETFGTFPGGAPNNGTVDVFVAKYSSVANQLWTRMLGGSQPDYAFGVAVAADGTVQVAGYTTNALDGNPYAGAQDAFFTRFDAAGLKLGTRTLGTSAPDSARGVAVDAAGNAYVTGSTYGGLGGNTNAGSFDAFLARF